MPSDSHPLAAEDRSDIVVIGNGVLGLSIAIEAIRRAPDARVTLIGPASRTGAATPAAAAMITAISEVLPTTDDDPVESAWFHLVRESVLLWPQWIEELTAAAELPPERTPRITRGLLVLGDEEDLAFDAIERTARRLAAPARRLDGREASALGIGDPVSRRRFLLLEDEGAVDPRSLLDHLELVAARLGVRRLDRSIIGIDTGRVRLTGEVSISAEKIVLAAGAGCTRMLADHPEAARRVPDIRFGIGVGLRCRTHSGLLVPKVPIRTPNRPLGPGTYCVPHSNGTFYVGATTELSRQPRLAPHQEEIDALRSRARELLGLSIADDDGEPVIGHRPVSVDGLPVLGRITDGMFIATGTNRDGLSGAPRIASLLGEALQGGVAAIPPVMRPSVDRTGGRHG